MVIEGVGVIGAEKNSLFICEKLLSSGFQVRVYDSFKDNLALMMAKLKWRLLSQNKQRLIDNIEPIQEFYKFKGAELIIETVNKSFEERYLYFSKILKEVGDNCIIAIDASIPVVNSFEKINILPIERVVGINPSRVFPFSIIEISKTKYTDLNVLNDFIQFVEKLGSKYVVVEDRPGGILFRLNRVYLNASFKTLYNGKGFPNEIDAAIKKMTSSIYGPFEYLDNLGIDYDYNTSVSICEMLNDKNELNPHEIELKLLQYGQLGVKSGLGIYIYEDGRIVGENPFLSNMVKYLGLRKVDDSEIFSDIMISVLEKAKEISKEMMIGEQDIENITKINFGWEYGIFGYQKKYPQLFVAKEKSEFDNLDNF